MKKINKKEDIKADKIAEILKTTDYDKFTLIEGNRRIKPKVCAKLSKSCEEQQLIIPITVNEKYEIIDGQHRFTTWQALGEPIYYYIVPGYGIDEVKRANMVGSNWTKEDYLHLHVENGLDDYVTFEGLLDKYGLNISDLLKIFAIVQKKNQRVIGMEFEKGEFDITGLEAVDAFLSDLDIFNKYPFYKTKQFVGAFTILYFNTVQEYDSEKMKKNLRVDIISKRLTKKNSILDYLTDLVNEVYSGNKGKTQLYFDRSNKKFYIS